MSKLHFPNKTFYFMPLFTTVACLQIKLGPVSLSNTSVKVITYLAAAVNKLSTQCVLWWLQFFPFHRESSEPSCSQHLWVKKQPSKTNRITKKECWGDEPTAICSFMTCFHRSCVAPTLLGMMVRERSGFHQGLTHETKNKITDFVTQNCMTPILTWNANSYVCMYVVNE